MWAYVGPLEHTQATPKHTQAAHRTDTIYKEYIGLTQETTWANTGKLLNTKGNKNKLEIFRTLGNYWREYLPYY